MRLKVQGGTPLHGTFTPSGNPNSAKALLAASMLTDQPITLQRVPRNTSTQAMFDFAAQLGVRQTWQGEHHVTLQTDSIHGRTLAQSAVGMLLLLAPLIVRRQHARLEVNFPLNRIRTHLNALRDLGLDVIVSSGAVEIRAAKWEQRNILLDSPSVTATEIVLMLAACLGKDTLIENAACEPQVVALCALLQQMGATIEGVGSNRLQVHGVTALNGGEATLGYDPIEIASVAAIVAMSGGRAQILPDDGGTLPDLRPIARPFSYFGLTLDADPHAVLIPRHERFTVATREEDIDASIETAPYPGFPSDLVTVAAVLATQAHGTTLIHEKLFKDRLLFVDTLKDMGAQIILADPHRAIILGSTRLRGTYIPAADPRFGLGMLGAALIADGESVIDNAEGFHYTFDAILGKLSALGAVMRDEG